LSFTVSTTGLTPANFEVLNGKGFYVASDVIDNNVSGNPTGDPEATGFTTTVVPEPSTLAFLGTGLFGLAGAFRRKLGL